VFTFTGYQGCSGRSVMLNTHFHLRPRLKSVELQHPPLCLHDSSNDNNNNLHKPNAQLQYGFVFVARRKRQTATRANTARPVALRMLLMEINPLATNVIYIYIYGAPILYVSRSHTTTHYSR